MKLTLSDVQKVARLARLKLSEDELSKSVEQLGFILEFIDTLNDVDTDDVEPMAHTAELVNAFRADVPAPSLDRNDALANAPQTDGRYFLVPAILEGA